MPHNPYEVDDPPCDVCGGDPSGGPGGCTCPTCSVCQVVGDPQCYKEHGLMIKTTLHLSEPDQHGCRTLMAGEVQLAQVMPEGAEKFKQWLALFKNLESLQAISAQQRETFSEMIKVMSDHNCHDERSKLLPEAQKLREDRQALRGHNHSLQVYVKNLEGEVASLTAQLDRCRNVLIEFVEDINSTSYEDTLATWPDLAETYGEAIDALEVIGIRVEDHR